MRRRAIIKALLGVPLVLTPRPNQAKQAPPPELRYVDSEGTPPAQLLALATGQATIAYQA